MHFSLLVISQERPTEETIAKTMAPFSEHQEDAPQENRNWDWYQIGGRWTGYLDGYKPEDDPANTKVCDLCGGTGKRDDELGRRTRAEDPTYTCNGCQGKGKSVAWPTQWVSHAKDTLQVKDLATPPKPTFALLKDGQWLSKSWQDADDNPDWKKQFNEIYAGLSPDAWVTIVDCHT